MGLGLKSGIEIERRNIETPNGFPALNHSTFGYPLLPAPKSLQDYLNLICINVIISGEGSTQRQ